MSGIKTSPSGEGPELVHVSRTVASDGVTTVALSGDVDMVVADGLLGALSEVIDDAATTGVVIDMSHVRFWDSSGVGALVTAYRKAYQRGTTLVIGDMSEQVRPDPAPHRAPRPAHRPRRAAGRCAEFRVDS